MFIPTLYLSTNLTTNSIVDVGSDKVLLSLQPLCPLLLHSITKEDHATHTAPLTNPNRTGSNQQDNSRKAALGARSYALASSDDPREHNHSSNIPSTPTPPPRKASHGEPRFPDGAVVVILVVGIFFCTGMVMYVFWGLQGLWNSRTTGAQRRAEKERRAEDARLREAKRNAVAKRFGAKSGRAGGGRGRGGKERGRRGTDVILEEV